MVVDYIFILVFSSSNMILAFLLLNRMGKTRLKKWFHPFTPKDQKKIVKELSTMLIGRPHRLCNFLDWREYKIIYKRYASLYFVTIVEKDENELMTLEVIHHFVEVLDRYFGNVCELDLIFNFHKAFHIIDEILLCGYVQESSKKQVLKYITTQDNKMEEPDVKEKGTY